MSSTNRKSRTGWILPALLVTMAQSSQAAMSGPLSPGTCIDIPTIGTAAWTNPTRATASDDSHVTKSLDLEATHYLVCTGFGFTLPDDAIVLGIVVDNEVSVGGLHEVIEDHAQRIVRDGTIGSSDRSSPQPWPITDLALAHGASDDLWGECWCALPPGSPCLNPDCGNVNDEDFGSALAARHTFGGGGRARVDAVRMTIFYEPAPPSPTRTPTHTPSSTPTRTMTPTRTATATITATTAICPARPLSGCTEPGKAKIKLTGNTSPLTRSFTWKWKRGTTAVERFGNPLIETAYALCLYSDEQLVTGLLLLPGGSCGRDPCWKSSRGQGFAYRNGDTNPSGIRSAILRAGAGAARIEVKAARDNLTIPMPLDPADKLTVTLVQTLGTGTQCWASHFSAPPIKSNLDRFEDTVPQR